MLALGTGTVCFKDAGDKSFDQRPVELIKKAIGRGFYHFHCAKMYGTEEEVGRAIQESGVPREKLFITNKVSHGIDDIHAALQQSLEKLQTGYFDLYLIHIPFFANSDADFQPKSIGVSDYLHPHVEATLVGATIPPAFNQIEFHPYLQRGDNYSSWLRENGLQVGSFKGLTPAFRAPDRPLCEPLARIAKTHDTTEAAVLLNLIIQNKVVAVTTTTKPNRLDEYAQALKITLTQDELQEITDVGSTYHFRTSWPEHFEADDRS
ncbi:NADP-dependent oxidoreductase domain-containing protein [Trichoderma austrokoningii]